MQRPGVRAQHALQEADEHGSAPDAGEQGGGDLVAGQDVRVVAPRLAAAEQQCPQEHGGPGRLDAQLVAVALEQRGEPVEQRPVRPRARRPADRAGRRPGAGRGAGP